MCDVLCTNSNVSVCVCDVLLFGERYNCTVTHRHSLTHWLDCVEVKLCRLFVFVSFYMFPSHCGLWTQSIVRTILQRMNFINTHAVHRPVAVRPFAVNQFYVFSIVQMVSILFIYLCLCGTALFVSTKSRLCFPIVLILDARLCDTNASAVELSSLLLNKRHHRRHRLLTIWENVGCCWRRETLTLRMHWEFHWCHMCGRLSSPNSLRLVFGVNRTSCVLSWRFVFLIEIYSINFNWV